MTWRCQARTARDDGREQCRQAAADGSDFCSFHDGRDPERVDTADTHRSVADGGSAVGGATTKPAAGESETEQATSQGSPGGSSQDDPGTDQNDLTTTETSDSDKCNDRGTDSSPSCGWRGVAREMGVSPGR